MVCAFPFGNLLGNGGQQLGTLDAPQMILQFRVEFWKCG